jgi:hypothetical protein
VFTVSYAGLEAGINQKVCEFKLNLPKSNTENVERKVRLTFEYNQNQMLSNITAI